MTSSRGLLNSNQASLSAVQQCNPDVHLIKGLNEIGEVEQGGGAGVGLEGEGGGGKLEVTPGCLTESRVRIQA